jgi:hypothetical protein
VLALVDRLGRRARIVSVLFVAGAINHAIALG